MEEVNILLLVLEKAEQILSLVNLPDSTIKKYNELKELTCNKLGIFFFPLKKSSNLFSTHGISNKRIEIDLINSFNLLKDISNKKSVIIEYLTTFFQHEYIDDEKDFHYNLLEQVKNLKQSFLLEEEFDYSIKLEDKMLEETIEQIEIFTKKITFKNNELLAVSNLNIALIFLIRKEIY
jgi:hypothetical protein